MSPNRPVVLLTGCTGLLGAQFAASYRERYRIVGVARRPPEDVPEGVDFLAADVSREAGRIVDYVLERHGAVDWLVNNAVCYAFAPLAQVGGEELLRQLRTNLVAPLELANACLARFWSQRPADENRERRRGVLNVSSISGIEDYLGLGQGAYAAAKAGLNTLTRHMAHDYAHFGLRANAVAPSSIPHRVAPEAVCAAMVELLASSATGRVEVLDPERAGGRRALPFVIRHPIVEVHSAPYRHAVVPGFFQPAFHEAVGAAFREVRARGLAEGRDRERLARFGHYDAYHWVFPPEVGYPLSFFHSREWKDYLSGAFGLATSDDVLAEFQHHAVGSARGYVHNDFNLAGFLDRPLASGINPWHHACEYFVRKGVDYGPAVRTRMRVLAAIYYLENPPWQAGDGGETGLYAGPHDERPARAVPPESGTLLVFEISPRSYHAFQANHTRVRNSINLWLHAPTEERLASFPGSEPAYFE